MKMIYDCDVNKNTQCPKNSCYINGGDCSKTHNEQFAIDGCVGETEEVFKRMINTTTNNVVR